MWVLVKMSVVVVVSYLETESIGIFYRSMGRYSFPDHKTKSTRTTEIGRKLLLHSHLSDVSVAIRSSSVHIPP